MNKIQSPFSDNRFELENRHLYYINLDTYDLLQEAKPCYIFGSRGTGKTTLLRSLSWEERLDNEALKRQIGENNFYQFIGIYIKLPDVQLASICRWLISEDNQDLKSLIYSRYLELILCESILETCNQLRIKECIDFSANDEFELVTNFVSKYKDQIYKVNHNFSKKPVTILELASSINDIRRYIEIASTNNTDATLVFANIGNPHQYCQLSQILSKNLSKLISKNESTHKLLFKICFDEAETLDELGILVLNTWVRLCTMPLSYLISFVSKPSTISKTLIPSITIQHADIRLINLDDQTDDAFTEFCEGVVNLRVDAYVKNYLPEYSGQFPAYSTEKLFGKLNLNRYLESKLKNSANTECQELLSAARLIANNDEGGPDDSYPLIYQAHVEQITGKKFNVMPTNKSWEKRKISSQSFRKTMVASYLSIFKMAQSRPIFASADMIIQLSDNCIRDYLNNIEYIFRKTKKPLQEFLTPKVILWTFQDAGLREAAKMKEKLLPADGMSDPDIVAKIISGLGMLTAKLQSKSNNQHKNFSNPERGCFVLDLKLFNENENKSIIKLIQEGCEANFLKRLSLSDLKFEFRMHTSLAPVYDFSYRGAYSNVTLHPADIIKFCKCTTDKQIDDFAEILFSRIDAHDDRNQDLFNQY